MRGCHLAVCPGGPGQYLDCKERSAFHEAGHALLLCLVQTRSHDSSQSSPLTGLTFGYGCSNGGGLALPDATACDPWHDALVLLGGPAADTVLYGCPPPEDHEDCARAKRLLANLGARVDFSDAFAATVELAQHHRGLLEVFKRALEPRGILSGSDMWRLYQGWLSGADGGDPTQGGAQLKAKPL